MPLLERRERLDVRYRPGRIVPVRARRPQCAEGVTVGSVSRPLAHLARDRDLAATIVRPEPGGRISPSALDRGARSVVVTHASNVSGSIQPVGDVAVVAARAGVPLLIDAAQSAGILPIDHRPGA